MAKKAQLPKSPPPKGTAQTKKPASSNARWVLLALIIGVVLLAAGVIMLQARSATPDIASVPRVGEGLGWGPVDAPVQIVEYSDFG